MAISLMVLFYGATLVAWRGHFIKADNSRGWRDAIIFTHLTWAVAVLALSELPSLFHAVAPGSAVFGWAILALLASYRAIAVLPQMRRLPIPRFSLVGCCFLGALGAIAILVGACGALAVPNTWDAMTYHLPRVMHWVQNHSVAHYYTHIDRQLFDEPWSEFAILQGYLLSGSDRVAFLVQWSSYCLSGVVLSLIAAELGASRRGQLLSGCLGVSMPMAILQGSSTQTDLNAALWLLCIIWFVLERRSKPRLKAPVALAVSIGLALATKPTACMFAAPFLVWYAVSSLKTTRVQVVKSWALIAAIALLMAAPHLSRNLAWFHSPFSPRYYRSENTNASIGPSTLLSNGIRNAACEINTPWNSLNRTMTASLVWLLSRAGINPNDPNTTYPHSDTFSIRGLSADEDQAGNPLHMLLLGLALTVFLIHYKKMIPATRWYLVAGMAAYLLFCLIIRWNPWNSRYLLPLMLTVTCWCGVVFDRALSARFTVTVAALCLVGALPWVVGNRIRPLVGPRTLLHTTPIDVRFAKRPYLIGSYTAIVDSLARYGCSSVGCDFGYDNWEYPLWAMLRERTGRTPDVFFVNLDSAGTGRSITAPVCAIVSGHDQRPDALQYHGLLFRKSYSGTLLSLYMIAPAVPCR